ncbi:hypothetical protein EUGRSUZ_C02019 [Eucalyptus grandis]|uniref:Uncharacterized protein n=2 Tax=Eucalyptus grandis TaxID=71139 RepID=A0ACC3LED7_EUCGR|nr:hypothetical protein EUGRSUZ_C02019 [Eucalyptus grandis]
MIGKLSVLIIDDDALIRKIHEKLMSNAKVAKQVQTQTATNGKEALDLHLSGSSFDIILVDMEMPILDGPEVFLVFAHVGGEGVTSRNPEAHKEAFVAAGLDECLEKPLTVEKIKSLVETLEKNQ